MSFDVIENERTELADILDQVHRYLGAFVAYPSKEAHDAHTLWIPHTHCLEAFESTPRLAFLSPEPGSGKTRALEVSEPLVSHPIEAVSVSSAFLFRSVGNEARPTILFDEVDTVFSSKSEASEEVRAFLNAGHRRGASFGRCVVRGREVATEMIPAFAAVALAGLGSLPDTILTRSVRIMMRRRGPGEKVEPYRRRIHAPAGEMLREQLIMWAASATGRLGSTWPDLPPEITDRDADVWEPLIAVADLAGGDWPKRARVAAVALVSQSQTLRESLGVRLLGDLRTVFNGEEQLPTETILADLHRLDESPWGDLRGKALDSRGLARLLRPYDIRPTTIRTATGTPKGYRRTDLHDAWGRYLSLSPENCATSATSDTPAHGWLREVTE